MNTLHIQQCMKKISPRLQYNVYPENRIPIFVQPPVFLISNLDPDSKPGSHWIAIHIDEYGNGEYFDSYGRKPGGHHMIFLRRNCYKWIYNTLSVQNELTSVCGEYCLVYLFYRYGLPFGAIIILCALLLPEPTYKGPENVTYFRGNETLEEELKKHKNTTWLICFYAAWHPACVNFAPVFAELSNAYNLDNLRFGKMDVGRYPEAAKKYRIQDGATSRQLPTVVLLQQGEESLRRPHADSSGKLQKFLFSKENIKAAFDLDVVYKQCKEKLANVKDTKKKD